MDPSKTLYHHPQSKFSSWWHYLSYKHSPAPLGLADYRHHRWHIPVGSLLCPLGYCWIQKPCYLPQFYFIIEPVGELGFGIAGSRRSRIAAGFSEFLNCNFVETCLWCLELIILMHQLNLYSSWGHFDQVNLFSRVGSHPSSS